MVVGRRHIITKEKPDPTLFDEYSISEEYYSGELSINGQPLALTAQMPVYHITGARYGADFSGLPLDFLSYAYAPSSGVIDVINSPRAIWFPTPGGSPAAQIEAIAAIVTRLRYNQ